MGSLRERNWNLSEEKRPPDEPQNLMEWMWHLKRYEDTIFVRVERDGKFESIPLSQADPRTCGEYVSLWVNRWLNDDWVPTRIRDEEE